MNEKRWAFVGKILALLATVLTLTLGAFQLTDRLTTPSIFAIVEFRNDYISPRIRDMFHDRIETKTLLDSIKARRKKGESPNRILEAIEDSLSEAKENRIASDLEMDFSLFRTMMVCTVVNDGSSLLREVKLVLPGEGQAEVSEKWASSQTKRLEWFGQVPLGDVRPKATVEVKVWFKTMLIGNIDFVNPAIVHAGGTGKVMELRSFYGWDVDAVAWFVARSLLFRVVIVASMITVLILLFWLAMRRGYIVLKPAKRNG